AVRPARGYPRASQRYVGGRWNWRERLSRSPEERCRRPFRAAPIPKPPVLLEVSDFGKNRSHENHEPTPFAPQSSETGRWGEASQPSRLAGAAAEPPCPLRLIGTVRPTFSAAAGRGSCVSPDSTLTFCPFGWLGACDS